MKPPAPVYKFDERLREIPESKAAYDAYLSHLEKQLAIETRPAEKASLLGDLGVQLRCDNRLDEAETALREALKIITTDRLGTRRQVQQNLRLANVLQWQGKFDESTPLFDETLATCRGIAEALPYLDFALHHSGKNLFDQGKWADALKRFEEALTIRKRREAPADQIQSTEQAISETKKRLLVPRK
ncbi:MAG: tetratricopeptide repeat protein [Bdellovibrionota bacterium]